MDAERVSTCSRQHTECEEAYLVNLPEFHHILFLLVCKNLHAHQPKVRTELTTHLCSLPFSVEECASTLAKDYHKTQAPLFISFSWSMKIFPMLENELFLRGNTRLFYTQAGTGPCSRNSLFPFVRFQCLISKLYLLFLIQSKNTSHACWQ